jgi:hypothetical protein
MLVNNFAKRGLIALCTKMVNKSIKKCYLFCEKSD